MVEYGMISKRRRLVLDRLLRERFRESLHPENTHSLLILVPGASGDVALNTTLVRYVKTINPACHITLATKKSNISVAELCPGVDKTIELSNESHSVWHRLRCIKMYEGFAETVVYTNCYPEDMDLFTEQGLNLMQTIWLLSGMAGGLPEQLPKIWLEAPQTRSASITTLNRSLGGEARQSLAKIGIKRLREPIQKFLHPRSFKGGRIKTVPADLTRLWRHSAETGRRIHSERLKQEAWERDFVLLGTHANSLGGPPKGVVDAIIKMLRRDGRTVLHNVLNPCEAAPGTIPLACSYQEFLSLRQAGMPFVGWRSGLCDIAAAHPAPMCVFYPDRQEPYRSPLATFGFGSMGVEANCFELVCRNAADVETSDFIRHLNRPISQRISR